MSIDIILALLHNQSKILSAPPSLEETAVKYLHPSDDYIILTENACKFDVEKPSYLIQSWLRSRNTVEFLAEWERKNRISVK